MSDAQRDSGSGPMGLLPGVDLTFDCGDAPRLAEFWKLALGYEDEPPPPPFATRQEWLRSHGVPPSEWGDGAWLRDPSGVRPRISFLNVPEGKAAKNRLHLDLRVAGTGSTEACWERIQTTVGQLCSAGASVLEEFSPHHVTMRDPEGNEFCVA